MLSLFVELMVIAVAWRNFLINEGVEWSGVYYGLDARMDAFFFMGGFWPWRGMRGVKGGIARLFSKAYANFRVCAVCACFVILARFTIASGSKV